MSGEGYKPDKKEKRKAVDSISDGQKKMSSERQKGLNWQNYILRADAVGWFKKDVKKASDTLDRQLDIDRLYGETNKSPAIVEDVEKARKIQSEILQKLGELDELFKFDPTK